MMLVDKMAETRRALRDASKQVIVALNRMHEVEEQVNNLARALGNNNRKHAASHRPDVKVKKTSSKLDVRIVPAYGEWDSTSDAGNWSADISTVAHRKPPKAHKSKNGEKVRSLLADGRQHNTSEARVRGIKNPAVYFNNEVMAGRAKRVSLGTYVKV